MGLSSLFNNPLAFFRDLLISLPGIVIGITFHEFAHAWMSDKLGDPTPRALGRVTLNPLAHIEPIGLVMLFLFGFGYGRPVMINPRYYKNRRRDEILVALAGVTMNFIIALVVYFLTVALRKAGIINSLFEMILISIVWYNIILMVFNLLPIPPLDGYKVVKTLFFHGNSSPILWRIEQYGFIILVALVFFGVTRSWLIFLADNILWVMINVTDYTLG